MPLAHLLLWTFGVLGVSSALRSSWAFAIYCAVMMLVVLAWLCARGVTELIENISHIKDELKDMRDEVEIISGKEWRDDDDDRSW